MKKTWMKTLVLCLMTLIIPFTASAEFYRYVDRNGNVIYTDDISKVPAEDRSKAKMYNESRSSITAEPDQNDQQKAASSAQTAETIQQEGRRLQAVQKNLYKEYNGLVKENADLKAEQQEAVTPDQIKSVNKKVVSFNARFNAYKEKESVYTAELETYNQRVRDAEADKAGKQ